MKWFALIILAFCLLPHPLGAQSREEVVTETPASSEVEKVLATFKGKPLTASDLAPDTRTIEMTRKSYSESDFQAWMQGAHSRKLNGLIIGTLFDDYREAEGIEPTQEEIDQFVEFTEKAERQSNREFGEQLDDIERRLEKSELAEEERAQLKSQADTLQSILDSNAEQEAFGRKTWGDDYKKQMRKTSERIAQQMITAWKLNRSLFERYGGRVIFQQAGPEPIDAYRIFLEEHRDAGDFEIIDPQLREAFWKYFVNDQMHVFYDEDEGARWMETPWWMQDLPIE